MYWGGGGTGRCPQQRNDPFGQIFTGGKKYDKMTSGPIEDNREKWDKKISTWYPPEEKMVSTMGKKTTVYI